MLLATTRYGKYLAGLWFIISWLLADDTELDNPNGTLYSRTELFVIMAGLRF